MVTKKNLILESTMDLQRVIQHLHHIYRGVIREENLLGRRLVTAIAAKHAAEVNKNWLIISLFSGNLCTFAYTKNFCVLYKVFRHSDTCVSKSTRSNRYRRRDVMR